MSDLGSRISDLESLFSGLGSQDLNLDLLDLDLSNEYVVAKISVDTSENELFNVHVILKLRDCIVADPPRPGGPLQPVQASPVPRGGENVFCIQ